jgi:hypothetical protein
VYRKVSLLRASMWMLAFFLLATSFQGCSSHSYNIKTVKPKVHHRYYNPKKDKHKSRVKKVKMKST